MEKGLRWMLVWATVLVVGAWFSGCGGKVSDGAVVRISSWGDAQENGILQGLIDDFEKKYPRIRVELQRVAWAEYTAKLLTQVAGNTAPDVIFVSTDNIADLYPRGILEPLTPYFQEDPSFKLDDFYPGLIDRFTVDGNLYVVPRDTSPVCVVYYNKNAFDEARQPYPRDDWDWNEFLAVARKVVKRDALGNTRRWAFVDDWPMAEPWIYSAGGRWVDDPERPTRYTVGGPEFLAGIQFRADLLLKYKVMPTPAGLTAMGGMGSGDLFINGTAAMFLSGIWKVPRFREIRDFKWDVAMFPKGPGGKRGFPGGGSGYGILRTSKHKKEAWELVKYISGEEGAKLFSATGLVQPALKGIAASPVFLDGKDPGNKAMLLEAAPYEVYDPMVTNWRETREGTIAPRLDRVWSGRESPALALGKLAQELKKRPLGLGKAELK